MLTEAQTWHNVAMDAFAAAEATSPQQPKQTAYHSGWHAFLGSDGRSSDMRAASGAWRLLSDAERAEFDRAAARSREGDGPPLATVRAPRDAEDAAAESTPFGIGSRQYPLTQDRATSAMDFRISEVSDLG
eukprot:14719466-Alexandrium_andersonii.AAC.1